MKKVLLLSLMLLSGIACSMDENSFLTKSECINYCHKEFDRMMSEAGFDHLSIEEDVGSYVAQIRFKHDKCIKNCQLLFN